MNLKTIFRLFLGGKVSPKFTLAELVKGYHPIGSHEYRTDRLFESVIGSGRVFGGQMMSHLFPIVADSFGTSGFPGSMHIVFLRPAYVNHPLVYRVHQDDAGNSPGVFSVKVLQNNCLVAKANLMFQKFRTTRSFGDTANMPAVPLPEDLPASNLWFKNYVQRVSSSQIDSAMVKMLTLGIAKLLESREVEEYHKTPEPQCAFWIRVRETVDSNRPYLHHAHACFISDTLMIAAALRPHVKKLRYMSAIGSLSHGVWFHRPSFNVNEWMLCETKCSNTSASRSYVTGNLWSKDGALLLSTAQEALVRHR